MNLRRYCPAFLFPLLQRAAALPDIIVFAYYKKICKVNPKGVVMLSSSRSELSGNYAFIANALKGSEFTVTTLLEGDGTTKQQRLKLLASNRFILLDDYTKFIYPLQFPKTTKVIQVWHSTGAFKRMGFARMGRRGSTVAASLTHRNYTHVIVSSPGVVQNFTEAFGIPETAVYPIGVPRTDLFFDKDAIRKIQDDFYNRYPHLREKKLILFAPTFRGDTRQLAHYPTQWFDPAAFIQQLPEDYILGIKLHPFITDKMPIPKAFSHRIVDFSAEREINPLLFVTDTLITDYSSVIFEYALLNRPIVFYLPDLKEYDRDRSFFYDFSTYVYGPCCYTQTELPAAVLHPTAETAERAAFLKRFVSACDGNATNRFVNQILREEDPR